MLISRFRIIFIVAIMAVSAVALSSILPVASGKPTLEKQSLDKLLHDKAIAAFAAKLRAERNPLIRGFLVAQVGGHQEALTNAIRKTAAKSIYLPGVKLVLDNPTTHQQSPAVQTDLSGRFTLRAPAGGSYRICWSSPVYGTGCTANFWTIGARPLYISAVPISLPTKDRTTAIYGHVTDLAGDSVRTFQPYFNVNAFARVVVREFKGKVLGEAFVNNLGDYLIPYLPVNVRLTVVAAVEGGKVQQDLLPEANLITGSFNELNLKIANHAPKLSPLAAADAAGHRVQNANPGDEVVVTAPARDDDPGTKIEYRWYVAQGEGTLSLQTGPVVRWKLPKTPGRHSISVIAYDGHGGYDLGALSLLADGKGTPFSGRIVNTHGAPIGSATVQIAGNLPVTTDSNGYFATRAKLADRYVFNARAKGFALNSQIYDHGVTGGRWILHTAEAVTFNPTIPNTLVNRRNVEDCVGPASWRARTGPAGDSIRIPQWQDGNGHVKDVPPEKRQTYTTANVGGKEHLNLAKCGSGVTVTLPANAIVDASGNTVKTPITAYISTVDLASPQQMPGDDGVTKKAGGGAGLESFGAGSFDLPAGMKLSGSAKATVTITVDRLPLSGGATPPAFIPLLSYDESKGLWKEEGTLTLQTIAGVPTYVGEVKHFSTFNADNVKDSLSACIRLFSPTLPPKYNLEVSAPYQGTGAPKIVSHLIDQTNGEENVLYNLPQNVNVTLTASTIDNPSNLLATVIVNSGNAASPNNSPLAPTYVTDPLHPGDVTKNGYIACNNFIVLKTGNAPDSAVGGEFLHGLGVLDAENLGFNDLTNAAATGNQLVDAVVAASKAYYDKVDPGLHRTNFTDFKTYNNFAANPAQGLASGEYVAQYANSGDLGFGRDMHCRVTDAVHGYVACYVTNYGSGYNNIPFGGGTDDQDDANAAGLRADVAQSKEIATVAMEYSPIEGDPSGVPVVKFYVFFNSPGYPRVIDANLDGRGQRPVPQLCMTCHGGFAPSQGVVQGAPVPIFNTAADTHLDARFLPFDYRLFTFPTDPALSASAQDAQFKHLNQDIADKVPAGALASDPIREVIHALYNSSGVPNSSYEQIDSPVTGWQAGQSSNLPGQTTFYNKVFAWGCRTCHIAQPFTQIQFNKSAGLKTLDGFPPANNFLMLGTVQNRVCGDYLMPHALRTHDIFWGNYNQYLSATALSLTMPQDLQAFGDAQGAGAAANWKPGLCTTFVSNNASVPSNFFKQSVQPIFNGKCVGCHIGNVPPGGLDLTEVNAFGQLHANNRVNPGSDVPNATNNKLLFKVVNNLMPAGCNVTPLPPGSYYTCLTPTDIAILKAWVKNGAN